MGCSLMKKPKQNLQQESDGVAEQQNQEPKSNPINLQISQENVQRLDQSQLLNNQDTQMRTPQPFLSTQDYQQSREMRKNRYKAQFIIALLGEEIECYRMKDDYFFRSSENQRTFSSPIKKLLQKSDRSIKVRPNNNIINIF